MSGKELKREFFKLKLFTQSLAELKDPHTPEFLNVREEKEINRHMNSTKISKKKGNMKEMDISLLTCHTNC